jgi:geranylgeranyl pyrophosphate synthase
MNSIIENANTRPSARRKAEKQRAECKENLQDLLVAENSPDQEQALREAIQRITRRHIARNPMVW